MGRAHDKTARRFAPDRRAQSRRRDRAPKRRAMRLHAARTNPRAPNRESISAHFREDSRALAAYACSRTSRSGAALRSRVRHEWRGLSICPEFAAAQRPPDPRPRSARGSRTPCRCWCGRYRACPLPLSWGGPSLPRSSARGHRRPPRFRRQGPWWSSAGFADRVKPTRWPHPSNGMPRAMHPRFEP